MKLLKAQRPTPPDIAPTPVNASNTLRFILFLVLNFIALGLGSFFTGPGVTGDWYAGLAKAPWTPPGVVFGIAWTGIMICFAFFMTAAWEITEKKSTLALVFAVQWILNVSWNPVFFAAQEVFAALVIITCLTLILWSMMLGYRRRLAWKSLWAAPYAIWLCIATSLNAYILFMNP